MSSSLILAALVGALIGAAVTALALGGWARVVSRRNARLHEDLLGATADAARSSERLRELRQRLPEPPNELRPGRLRLSLGRDLLRQRLHQRFDRPAQLR